MSCSICKHEIINKRCKFCVKKKRCDPCGHDDCFFCNTMTFALESVILDEWSEVNSVKPNMVWKTSQKKIIRKCKKCQREYTQKANNMLSHGCILCNNISERKVYDFLREKKYSFEYQIQFSWCKNFTFDFCIDNIIIEIDGPQHFKPVKSWSSGWKTMYNDIEKENLALANNHYIIRVAQRNLYENGWKEYLQENIDKIKKNEFQPCVITQNCKEYNSGIYKRLHTQNFFF